MFWLIYSSYLPSGVGTATVPMLQMRTVSLERLNNSLRISNLGSRGARI